MLSLTTSWSFLRGYPVWSKYSSGASMVVLQESAQPLTALDRPISGSRGCPLGERDDVAETLMVSFPVIVDEIRFESPTERGLPEQDHPGETLRLYREHEPFRVGVQVRALWGQLDRFHAGRLQDIVEPLREVAVTVVEQVLAGRKETDVGHCDVPCHLRHPDIVGVPRQPGDVDSTRCDVDEEEHVVRHEAGLRPDLRREEVGGCEHVHVCSYELLPRRGLLAVWRRRNPMALQHVPDGLIAHDVAKVCKGANDAVVAPASVLACEADDQILDISIDRGPAGVRSLLRAIELPRDEPSVPGQDRVGLDDVGHLLEGLAPELFPDLGESFPLPIGQAQSAAELPTQDLVLGREVLVSEEQLLVDGAGDVGTANFGTTAIFDDRPITRS